jgi:hypothetical protein
MASSTTPCGRPACTAASPRRATPSGTRMDPGDSCVLCPSRLGLLNGRKEPGLSVFVHFARHNSRHSDPCHPAWQSRPRRARVSWRELRSHPQRRIRVTAGGGTLDLLPVPCGCPDAWIYRAMWIACPARRGGIAPAGRRPRAERRPAGGPVRMQRDVATGADVELLAVERRAVDVAGLTVRLTGEAQDRGVVDEPIGDGHRLGGRREKLGPLLEREIRNHHG